MKKAEKCLQDILKLRCDSRFQRAFIACSCVFKVITLVWDNQGNFFENATACNKRTLKTTVATQLKNVLKTFFCFFHSFFCFDILSFENKKRSLMCCSLKDLCEAGFQNSTKFSSIQGKKVNPFSCDFFGAF